MKRSDVENKTDRTVYTTEMLNAQSTFQTAETLEEINQKTLTIRDQFALAALQGLLAGFPVEMDENLYAPRAYILADAMLEARK